MTKSTLRRWSRDALEILHHLKHETNHIALDANTQSHRVVALVDAMISASMQNEQKKSGNI